MLAWFANLSLRSKFVTVTMLVGMVSTAFATVSFLAYANSATRTSMVREITALVQILSENSGAALVFNDPKAATETLSALRVRPDVVGVCITTLDGQIFAKYGTMPAAARERSVDPTDAVRFLDDHLLVIQPVQLDGEVIGYVELAASLDVLLDERNALILIAAAITVVSALIAFGLSSTLQRAVIRPITHLAEVMGHVSTERAYGHRARRETNDELGELITGFNHMLQQIQSQHEELGVYRAQLEQLVRDRTAQLEEANDRLLGTVDELRRSRDELEAAYKTKTTFLANMSHELRTPLNAILGFSEIMMMKLFGPLGDRRYESYAEDISKSGAHLLDIISEILDMTRLESGKLDLKEDIVEIESMIDDALRIVSPALVKKRITLTNKRPDGPRLVLKCDPVRVRQVLINLLSNASKFTRPNGSVEVRVSVGGPLKVEIADTGIGIAEEDQERVLTPFAQVENAYARAHHGTGLGLSLSKALMEQHGGALLLDSTLGVGTTVTLLFPSDRVVRPDVPAKPPQQPVMTDPA